MRRIQNFYPFLTIDPFGTFDWPASHLRGQDNQERAWVALTSAHPPYPLNLHKPSLSVNSLPPSHPPEANRQNTPVLEPKLPHQLYTRRLTTHGKGDHSTRPESKDSSSSSD
jgi:hypothetical protein